MARISTRYQVVAFGQDLSLFTAWSVIPVWAKLEVKASPIELGALPIFSGLAYVLGSILNGRLSDRVSRTTMARLGFVLYAGFCFLAWRAPSIGWIYLVATLGGVASSFIWPGLQALVGDESGPDDLERNLGIFSLSWSTGKMLGFFAGGPAYEHFGLGALAGCGLLSLVLIPIVPSRRAGHRAVAARLVADDGPPAATRAAYLRAAWIANFAAYGLGAVLNFLYEDIVVSLGRDPLEYNVVLGTVFLAQTVSFWAFGRFSGWRYRPGAFLFWQAMAAGSILVIGLGVPLAAALPAALLTGTGLGLGYSASIYYSVHTDEARGARAGIHEAILGASNFAIPFVGGALQRSSGSTLAPYAFAAAVVAAAIVIEIRILRGASVASTSAGLISTGTRSDG